MADIKDIFGESDSEDDNDQQQAPVDVGKLFELSEDEEEAPIQRKRPAGRLQKNAAAAPLPAVGKAVGTALSENQPDDTSRAKTEVRAEAKAPWPEQATNNPAMQG